MVEAGVLSEAAAERHPQANVVTRALGVAPTIVVDSVTTELEQGDRLMLCSDGCRGRSMRAISGSSTQTLAGLADRLLANALQRDGGDNTTLIVIGRTA